MQRSRRARWTPVLILAAATALGASSEGDENPDRGPAAAGRLSSITVQAEESCEPVRSDCSVAAALAAVASGGTIELGPGRHRANLKVARDVTLVGAGPGVTFLDGGGAGRVLKVEPGARVTVRGVTLTGGRLDKELEWDGGGIWNVGELRLERCEVTGNAARDDGGGIRNDGTLTLVESWVHGNEATRWGSAGGGIYSPVILGDPVLRVISSTISGNFAGDNGGGIWCEGSVEIVNSTISGNRTAHTGGGIRNNGALTVNNSTIAFNHAGTTGGGLRNFGTAVLSNTLLAANTAGEGGADCGGPLTSGGHNLLGEPAGCYLPEPGEGDLLGTVPGAGLKLGPLADNGGPSPDHSLGTGSAARDAGSPAAAGQGPAADPTGACAASDQRGRQRPLDGDGDGVAICDIGAVEAADQGPASGSEGR